MAHTWRAGQGLKSAREYNAIVASRYFKGLELLEDLHGPAGVRLRAGHVNSTLYDRGGDVLEEAFLQRPQHHLK